jgi:hypothetical protein
VLINEVLANSYEAANAFCYNLTITLIETTIGYEPTTEHKQLLLHLLIHDIVHFDDHFITKTHIAFRLLATQRS